MSVTRSHDVAFPSPMRVSVSLAGPTAAGGKAYLKFVVLSQ